MVTINSWGSADPAEVAKGCTGRSSHTAYAVLCGGTTTTAAQQSIASVGTSGHILTSNGASALPTFQAAAGGGAGQWDYVSTTTASTSATLDWTGLTAANSYKLVLDMILPDTNTTKLYLRVSDDNGATWEAGTDYSYVHRRWTTTGQSNLFNSANASEIRMTENSGVSTHGDGISGEIILHNINVSGEMMYLFHSTVGTYGSQTETQVDVGGGMTSDQSGNQINEIDGVSLLFDSGNILSGSVYLYKLVTS